MCIKRAGHPIHDKHFENLYSLESYEKVEYGKLSVDPKSRAVWYDGRGVTLPPKEYYLLLLFLRHPQQVFSTEAIIERLWSLEKIPTHSSVRSHIKCLRKALRDAGATEEIIATSHGVGYRLNPAFPGTHNILKEKAFLPPASVLANLLDAKSIDYVIVDVNGKITYISPRVLTYLGLTHPISVGQDIGAAFPIPSEFQGDFKKIINREINTLIVKGIQIESNQNCPQYIDLYAIVDCYSDAKKPSEQNLFIFFEDASQIMLCQQKLEEQETERKSLNERLESP